MGGVADPDPVSLAAIAAVRLAKLDPLIWMFYRWGNFGGFLVFGLLAATSVAVLVRFRRNPEGEPIATRLVAPLVAAAGLGVMVYWMATNYASLINVDPHSREAWAWPWSNAAIAFLGLLRGLYMKKFRRTDYAALPHYQPDQSPIAPAPRAPQPQTVGGW
jgi:fructose-specific phosphotransferase system IIC component